MESIETQYFDILTADREHRTEAREAECLLVSITPIAPPHAFTQALVCVTLVFSIPLVDLKTTLVR